MLETKERDCHFVPQYTGTVSCHKDLTGCHPCCSYLPASHPLLLLPEA